MESQHGRKEVAKPLPESGHSREGPMRAHVTGIYHSDVPIWSIQEPQNLKRRKLMKQTQFPINKEMCTDAGIESIFKLVP